MRIVIHAGGLVPIDSETLSSRPLGGTETGVILVAEELQKRGHEITVLTCHRAPVSHEGVQYRNRLDGSESFDVFIGVQDWRTIFNTIKATRRYLWIGDGPEQFINFGIGDRRVVDRCDGLLMVSDWQRKAFAELAGFPQDRIHSIRNGVVLERFQGSEPRNRQRLVYASSPNRGLRLALILFQRLWRDDPNLEFHSFGGFSVYDRDKPYAGPMAEEFAILSEQANKLPNVFFHGNVPQTRLARELMKAGLLFYPNSFVETSCIVALEAMAAGTPIIASSSGGLPETVGAGGVLIEGQVGSAAYVDSFLRQTKRILDDQTWWHQLSKAGRERVKKLFTWEKVVDNLLAVIQ